MIILVKRLTLICAIIFIPAFLAAFFSYLFIATLSVLDANHDIPKSWRSLTTTITLMKVYLEHLWEMLIITAVGTDFYFYILKGYKRNSLVFYGFKSFSVFLILFTSVLLYYADSFGILEAHNLGRLPQYFYGFFLAIALIVSGVSIVIVYRTHKGWVFPHYVNSND